MHGILIVDKPAGFTSHDVVAKLRGICGTKKIGHGGTLDPMATGVLPVFIGRAAKAVDLQPRTDKTYEAVLRLGERTDTGDVTGTVLERAQVHADEAAVRAVLPQFVGESAQVPPMYSAVKVNGQPLYKAARRGQQVERKARPIVIHSLELLGQVSEREFLLRVHCGKGTYVRVLLEDIGRALGAPATMSALRRTAAGPYTLADAHTLDEIQAARDAGTLEALLRGVDTVFAGLAPLEVDEAARSRLLNGAAVYRVCEQDGRRRIYCGGEFVGVGAVRAGVLTQEKIFCGRE